MIFYQISYYAYHDGDCDDVCDVDESGRRGDDDDVVSTTAMSTSN